MVGADVVDSFLVSLLQCASCIPTDEHIIHVVYDGKCLLLSGA